MYYKALGWVVWRVAKHQARKKAVRLLPSRRVGAVAIVALLLAAGAIAAARHQHEVEGR